MKLLLLGLTAICHAAIASAHLCDCIDHGPGIETHHWLAAGGYAALTFLAVVVMIRQLVVGCTAEDDGGNGGDQ